MLDPNERAQWYLDFLRVARKFPDERINPAKWARSMSMIAEQFVPCFEDDEEIIEDGC